jgi:hypothetical protein
MLLFVRIVDTMKAEYDERYHGFRNRYIDHATVSTMNLKMVPPERKIFRTVIAGSDPVGSDRPETRRGERNGETSIQKPDGEIDHNSNRPATITCSRTVKRDPPHWERPAQCP